MTFNIVRRSKQNEEHPHVGFPAILISGKILIGVIYTTVILVHQFISSVPGLDLFIPEIQKQILFLFFVGFFHLF
jgi:hypothetical protein